MKVSEAYVCLYGVWYGVRDFVNVCRQRKLVMNAAKSKVMVIEREDYFDFIVKINRWSLKVECICIFGYGNS